MVKQIASRAGGPVDVITEMLREQGLTREAVQASKRPWRAFLPCDSALASTAPRRARSRIRRSLSHPLPHTHHSHTHTTHTHTRAHAHTHTHTHNSKPAPTHSLSHHACCCCTQFTSLTHVRKHALHRSLTSTLYLCRDTSTLLK